MLNFTAILGSLSLLAAQTAASKATIPDNVTTLANPISLAPSFYSARLFVSSYSGLVTTLSLTNNLGAYSLKPIAHNGGCAPSPSWLVLDKPNAVLYCINEGLNVPNGSVSTFKIQSNGTLSRNVNVTTQAGPVAGTLFGAKTGGTKHTAGTPTMGFAIAHYNVGAISTFVTDKNGSLLNHESESWNLTHPGPVKERQLVPHAHEVVLDPTERFLLVPDLGGDQIQIYSYDPPTLGLKSAGSLKVKPGSGPRHIAFSRRKNDTEPLFMYVVAELDSSLTGFQVTYPAHNASMNFTQILHTNTFGSNPTPHGAAAAEIALSPVDDHFLISNRNDSTFALPNRNPKNATAAPTDSLASYKLLKNGTLEFAQLWPAGGSFPRSFQMNEKGTLVAVGEQMSGRVVVIERDAKSGLLGREVACFEGMGEVTSVIWGEEDE
ncbi:MAG: hypothetical protein M1828_005524 [Chrysothrix sp. TS-e1954]|nr:MAG: hypothetical protein M1828_005524 [Chrysothrix sp. TS-e1954]